METEAQEPSIIKTQQPHRSKMHNIYSKPNFDKTIALTRRSQAMLPRKMRTRNARQEVKVTIVTYPQQYKVVESKIKQTTSQENRNPQNAFRHAQRTPRFPKNACTSMHAMIDRLFAFYTVGYTNKKAWEQIQRSTRQFIRFGLWITSSQASSRLLLIHPSHESIAFLPAQTEPVLLGFVVDR
jgi:hypothetical protein